MSPLSNASLNLLHFVLMSQLEPIKRTTGYLNRLNKHNKFFNPKSTKSKAVQYTPDEIVMPKQYKKYQKDRGEPQYTLIYSSITTAVPASPLAKAGGSSARYNLEFIPRQENP